MYHRPGTFTMPHPAKPTTIPVKIAQILSCGPDVMNMSNVEVNRSKEGAARAPHETCLTKESVPTIGYAAFYS
jgi:hypothetical protein